MRHISIYLCSISGISEIFEKRGVYDSRVQTAAIASSFVRFQGNENYDTQCTEAWGREIGFVGCKALFVNNGFGVSLKLN